MGKLKIYLDNCCFNRPFDDQSQIKVYLETEAKLYIQSHVKDGTYDLVWSYMLDFENNENPYEDKKNAIRLWKDIASICCKSSPDILSEGKNLMEMGISAKDALHIACAIHCGCGYFITTDIKLLKKQIKRIKMINPVNFIAEMEANNENG